MRINHGDPHRVATILPGRAYTTLGPLLHFSIMLLQDRGWTTREVAWEDGDRTTPEAATAQAVHEIAAVSARTHLIVAKSLGTLVLPEAVDRDLPGVWLTPVLERAEVAAAVRALTAPSLVVGGTADELWDPTLTAGPGARVLEIEGADHSLELGTDVDRSLAALRQVVDAMASFVAGLEA